MNKPTVRTLRHVCGISGGKDSAALAIYMRNKRPDIDMEYYFCDTQKELPETYDFLVRIESYLGKPIARLNPDMGFDHWLKIYNGYLPSTRMRWCTRQLKIRPFEQWVGDDNVLSYIAIRSDEDRQGYASTKPNIQPVYPFIEDGITFADVQRILKDSGVGLPTYYEWRTRSGCYFCFFQRKSEWIGLMQRHPDLFRAAMAYEKEGDSSTSAFTWSDAESLAELSQPERVAEILAKQEAALDRARGGGINRTLGEVLAAGGYLESALDEESDDRPCNACHL